MADDKLADVRRTGAEYLVGADCGCLMHLQGRMQHLGGGPRVLHLAELIEAATRPPGVHRVPEVHAGEVT